MQKYLMNIIIIAMIISGCIGNLAAQSGTDSMKLSARQQDIVVISAYAATGKLDKLSHSFHQALNAGMTVNQAKEVMVHLYAYCGFPRSLRGLQTLMTVLEERKQKGIVDSIGRSASPINDSASKYERGKKILSQLTGVTDAPVAGYAAFSPEIEVFLKEHLFADIFERDVLNYTERELVTISVLSSIGAVEPMLQSHYSICLNIGLTPQQLRHFVSIINTHQGKSAAGIAETVLTKALANFQSK